MANEIKLPALTESMLEGVIISVFVKEGESIKAGDVLFDVETDKATVEIESPVSGMLLKLYVEEGDAPEVGDILAIIGEQEELGQISLSNTSASSSSEGWENYENVKKPKSLPGVGKPASPVARRIAKENNININDVIGTGINNMITGDDVKIFLATNLKEPHEIYEHNPKYGDEEVIELKGIREKIAEKMSISRREIPEVTTFTEVDMTSLLEFKEQHNSTITTYVVKATINAIQEFPNINSSIIGNTIHVKKYINIGVAAASDEGLIVPVIHNAEHMSLMEVGRRISELSQKIKNNKLSPSDLVDGTFTITNSGVFGSLFFTPIINYPECAILGMGKIEKRPAVVNDKIEVRSLMYMALSYDHRIVDGATAVKFLKQIKDQLENPQQILDN